MKKDKTYDEAFADGVCFVVEELAMNMEKNAVQGLWTGGLKPDRKKYIATMKENNPEIYIGHVKPYLKELVGYTKNK